MSFRRPGRSGRWAYVPIPLVATAVVLVVLILFTPILFESGGPAPGSLEVQGVLTVTPEGMGSATQFYVHSVGGTVHYSSIAVRAGSGFLWTGVCPTSGVNWSAWQNVSNVPVAIADLSTNPVVVNVNATYTKGGQVAIYAGMVAFQETGGSLSYASCYGTTPGSGSVGLSSSSLSLLLSDWGSGGPP